MRSPLKLTGSPGWDFLHLFLRRNNWETGEISHSLTLVSQRSHSCLGEMNETLWDLFSTFRFLWDLCGVSRSCSTLLVTCSVSELLQKVIWPQIWFNSLRDSFLPAGMFNVGGFWEMLFVVFFQQPSRSHEASHATHSWASRLRRCRNVMQLTQREQRFSPAGVLEEHFFVSG